PFVILVFFFASVVFYFPGNLQFDATVQWFEARTSVVTSNHPPFFSFIWHFLDEIVPGPGLMLVLELAVFWLSVFFLLKKLKPSLSFALATIGLFSIYPFFVA